MRLAASLYFLTIAGCFIQIRKGWLPLSYSRGCDTRTYKWNAIERGVVMLISRKILVSGLLILSLLISSEAAVAKSTECYPENNISSAENMAVDIMAARPIGLAAMVGGAVVFLVSWPFSALGGNSDEAWDTLVVAPAEYTFRRPLGNFEHKVMSCDN